MSRFARSSARGQILVLFTLSLVALLLLTGLVVDGGYAFSQRREAQNAADFAAMAGTRIVGEALTGLPAGAGTAANVEAAIEGILADNSATLVSAQYVDKAGRALGNVVGAGAIPSGTNGVVVAASTSWRPFFLGVVGVTSWSAGGSATAMTPGSSQGGNILPVGLSTDVYDALTQCPVTNLDACASALEPDAPFYPGNFGWLKFGLQGHGGKCDWTSSLGMIADGGCQDSKTFLDSEIVPPADSHGCCTQVGLPGSKDRIGGLTGNEWGDLSFYIQNEIPVWVPIFDPDASSPGGANAYYQIVGFGAIVFTGDNEHAKWLEGAAISGVGCPGSSPVAGTNYCTGPGGAFTIGVTGAVTLVR